MKEKNLSTFGTTIYNLSFPPRDYFKTFTIDRYTFTSNANPSLSSTYSPKKDWREIRPTAKVSIQEEEELSIIYQGGKRVNRLRGTETKRHFLDDILLLMSLCLGRNMVPEYMLNSNEWPVVARNHLERVSKTPDQLRSDIVSALGYIKSTAWQQQYLSGFHLRMIFHAANVLNTETRFLAFFVPWEWLYSRLTGNDKENNLREILSYILKYFWPNTNRSIFNAKANNILQTLRNQLAHSGMLPITNRGDLWMRALSKEDLLERYVPFFIRLTQIVVLKTIGLNCEGRIYGFNSDFNSFLSQGKL